MSNDPGSKDDGRAAKPVPGPSTDGAQVPPQMQPVRLPKIGSLKTNDSQAFRSGAPRDVAMPSSTSRLSSAELLKIEALAFKSDAPSQTRDAAMLSDVSRRIPPEALRPLMPRELLASSGDAPPRASLFSRLRRFLRGLIGLNRSR